MLTNWQTTIYSSLDNGHVAVKINHEKAQQLVSGLKEGKTYYLCLQAGFDLEIVKVTMVFHDMLTLERGKKGTEAMIWPAGTLLQAKIGHSALSDLRLDPQSLCYCNNEAYLTTDGDVITKLSRSA